MALLFSPLPHTDAAERISSLPVLLRPDFDQLLPELRAYAFTVSGLTQLGAIVEAREKIAKVTTGETTWDRAKRDLAGELSPWLDEKQALRRGELLLRTHTFRGYAAARYRSLMAQRDVFPYWQYVTHGDGRVRPAHAALNGKIFPAGHPIWQKIFPPWGWGCRCLIVPRMRRDVERIAGGEGNKAPEAKSVWDGELADAINSADRLPSGISLKQDTNWNWKPGELRPDLVELRKRYQDADPEAWSAFEQWAREMGTDGKKRNPGDNQKGGPTIWAWLGGEPLQAKARKVAKVATTPKAKKSSLAEAVDTFQKALGVKVAFQPPSKNRGWGARMNQADTVKHLEVVGAEWQRLRVAFPGLRKKKVDTFLARSSKRGLAHVNGPTPYLVTKTKEWSPQSWAAIFRWEKDNKRSWGTERPGSQVIDNFRHELAHSLSTPPVLSAFKQITASKYDAEWFRQNVSEYAATNQRESVAELFGFCTRADYVKGTFPPALEEFVFKTMLE